MHVAPVLSSIIPETDHRQRPQGQTSSIDDMLSQLSPRKPIIYPPVQRPEPESTFVDPLLEFLRNPSSSGIIQSPQQHVGQISPDMWSQGDPGRPIYSVPVSIVEQSRTEIEPIKPDGISSVSSCPSARRKDSRLTVSLVPRYPHFDNEEHDGTSRLRTPISPLFHEDIMEAYADSHKVDANTSVAIRGKEHNQNIERFRPDDP